MTTPTVQDLDRLAGGVVRDPFQLPDFSVHDLRVALGSHQDIGSLLARTQRDQIAARDNRAMSDDPMAGKPAEYAKVQIRLRQAIREHRTGIRAAMVRGRTSHREAVDAAWKTIAPRSTHEEGMMTALAQRFGQLGPEQQAEYYRAALIGQDQFLARALVVSHRLLTSLDDPRFEALANTLVGPAIAEAETARGEQLGIQRLALHELKRLEAHLDAIEPTRAVLVAAGVVEKTVAEMSDAEKSAFIGKHGLEKFEVLAFGGDPFTDPDE